MKSLSPTIRTSPPPTPTPLGLTVCVCKVCDVLSVCVELGEVKHVETRTDARRAHQPQTDPFVKCK